MGIVKISTRDGHKQTYTDTQQMTNPKLAIQRPEQ